MPKPRKLLVVQCAALGWAIVSRQKSALSFSPLETVFPAVTCTAQASFRTGRWPRDHGMVGNGLYFRELQRPMFWEQSAALVEGERIWHSFRARGGTVGMMFWQQSLGEEVDLVLSPKPIHKHSGGMIQDCYCQPHDLYARLCEKVGRRFNLMHYWGPLATHKSSDWIVDAVCATLDLPEAPDLLLCYIPHLDYDLQRFGPEDDRAGQAWRRLERHLVRLQQAASQHEYDFLFYGDYVIGGATSAVYPNRVLKEAGLFSTRMVKGKAYPDFFGSAAFAMVDHEVAHVFARDAIARERAASVLRDVEGIGDVLDRSAQAARSIDHARSGERVLVADEGRWFAYPWWTERSEAPDYATHVDIHNKPGYDPCELFFGWPPFTVSMDTRRIHGTHGRCGAGREIAWTTSCTLPEEPANLVELALGIKAWLNAGAAKDRG